MRKPTLRRFATSTLALVATAALSLGVSTEAWGKTVAWDAHSTTGKTVAWDAHATTTGKTVAWDAHATTTGKTVAWD